MQKRPSVVAKASTAHAGPRTSIYRGVSYNKKAKKWYARVGMCGGKEKFIGSFDDEIAAARAFDAFLMAQKLHKPLNFPNASPRRRSTS